jgi:hypothetical protein
MGIDTGIDLERLGWRKKSSDIRCPAPSCAADR